MKKYYPFFFLAVVAVFSRLWVLGNPFIYSDEEFYLFVGGQMLHGALPFVDIWDRKPIGLFLLYEFFHLFGPYRIYAYQIGALVSAWLTSCVIYSISRHIAPYIGSLLAGVLYLFWVVTAHGEGGQSPIFYNLLVVGSVFLISKQFSCLDDVSRLRIVGIEVMFLIGISMQIKYTTMFEGVYLGCTLLWMSYKGKASYKDIFLNIMLWVGIAVAPTFIAFGVYAWLGYGEQWWFCNVVSMSYRHISIDAHNLKYFIFIFGLSLSCIWGSWICRAKGTKEDTLHKFLLGWAMCAFLGYCVLREFPKHYSLPLFAPIFVLAASMWRVKVGRAYLLLLVLLGMVKGYAAEKKDMNEQGQAVLSQVRQAVSSPAGCSFMFTGQSILLDAVPYCSLTRYPFPAHLSYKAEKDALGVNPEQELQRILAEKPLYLFDSHNDDNSEENKITRHIFDDHIHKYYDKIYEHKRSEENSDIIIYRMKGAYK